MPKKADFAAVYDPAMKQIADIARDAVQKMLTHTYDEQKALGASPQVLAVLTDSIHEYNAYHGSRFK